LVERKKIGRRETKGKTRETDDRPAEEGASNIKLQELVEVAL
jgi:hypothetical protein